jgi:hypothetical protein
VILDEKKQRGDLSRELFVVCLSVNTYPDYATRRDAIASMARHLNKRKIDMDEVRRGERENA